MAGGVGLSSGVNLEVSSAAGCGVSSSLLGIAFTESVLGEDFLLEALELALLPVFFMVLDALSGSGEPGLSMKGAGLLNL